ncbi:MAG: hypothetical protein QGH40_08205, partial [bacterium]|nr:hypothetical protein [bacterium]
YFTSFGYFNDKENAVVIMNVARALKIGGRFLLESINHDFIVKNGRLHNINERDGNLMLDTSRFDPVKSRIFTRRRIIRDGRDYETGFTVRLYTPPELKQLLGAGGFVIETFYGGRDKPFEVTSPRLVVVARKQS